MRIEKKHYDAFNFWFGCTQEGDGVTEALNRTAVEFDVSERTIRRWYSDMDWSGLSDRRLRDIQREVERRDNRTFAQNQKKYLDIFHRLLYDYVEDGLPAKIESIKDLEIVVKNSLLLQNQPTENVQQKTEHSGEVRVESEPLFNRELMEEILEQESGSSDDVELLDGSDEDVLEE